MDWFDEQRQNFESLSNFSDRLIDGLTTTVLLTLLGGAVALVVAVVLGLMAGSPSLWLRGPARVLIEFFRGISLLVLLFWMVYVLPIFIIRMDLPIPGPQDHTFTTGVFALGINYGAYAAEAVRASLTTVPKGQWEATTALSMSWPHRMRRIIFPQAWALMIPSLANLWIHLLKGSAIVYILPRVDDLTFELNNLRRPTDIWFSHAMVGLVTYFVLALVLLLFMQALEARAKHRLGRGPGLKEILSVRLRPQNDPQSAPTGTAQTTPDTEAPAEDTSAADRRPVGGDR